MKFSLSFASIGKFFASNRADAFSAVSPYDAQTSSILAPENIPKVAKAQTKIADPKIFDDVQLPKSLDERVDYLLQVSKQSNKEDVFLRGFLPALVPDLEIPPALGEPNQGVYRVLTGLLGKEKPGKTVHSRSQEFRNVYTKLMNSVIKTNVDDRDPCEDYLYFGNQDYTKILPMICQVIPFWASALTVGGDNDEHLELNAYDSASHPDSKYLTIMNAMIPDSSRNINVRFNIKGMAVNQIVTYESGKAVIVPEEEWSYYASGFWYNMMYLILHYR